ncbi:uncharacterized protein MCYG_05323 [Microsporum canis CBS 113480]|uniref:Uncharacterized protein n=1 Tax=Arthroderma otae (strain ATCC MYA-4605 / CBS 113480) TaxID=554155 RepID=C5FRK1_ARTOC|nr:uncharacterized protein MCYG_05323 [Microsporum canis CBS 113480]EEQ32504.1 predicted protein [Microsporum canis CBS 113480]
MDGNVRTVFGFIRCGVGVNCYLNNAKQSSNDSVDVPPLPGRTHREQTELRKSMSDVDFAFLRFLSDLYPKEILQVEGAPEQNKASAETNKVRLSSCRCRNLEINYPPMIALLWSFNRCK